MFRFYGLLRYAGQLCMQGTEMADIVYVGLIFAGFALCWLGVIVCERL
jgi:hypothetical protein